MRLGGRDDQHRLLEARIEARDPVEVRRVLPVAIDDEAP
jgi:hypothetical protein